MKKIIFRIHAVFTVCLTLIMSISVAGVNVYAAEKSWQEAYLDVIDNSHDDASAYLLCNIDDNEIPELYLWDNTKHHYVLYTYYDGKSVLCDEWDMRESMWIYDNKNGGFWSTRKSNALYYYLILSKLENGSCSELYTFCIDRSEMPTEKYLINDEDVGKEEYERKMAELEENYSLSSDFQVNGKLSQTYDDMKKYLLDSIESENGSANKPVTTGSTEATDSSTTSTTAAATKTSSNTTTKREGSPKTGNTEPVLCELVVIGFIAVGTFKLLRKNTK